MRQQMPIKKDGPARLRGCGCSRMNSVRRTSKSEEIGDGLRICQTEEIYPMTSKLVSEKCGNLSSGTCEKIDFLRDQKPSAKNIAHKFLMSDLQHLGIHFPSLPKPQKIGQINFFTSSSPGLFVSLHS
jgi:hypothetical protein